MYMKCLLIPLLLMFTANTISAQTDTDCKVETAALRGTYAGECKNGLASGKGEAKGLERYVGNFKNGMPNGEGTYYFKDGTFFIGNFQDGLREGKGEMHFPLAGKADSVLKGYWCADEYRGKEYVRYKFGGSTYFDKVDIIPSKESGHMLTIEISTNSGSPDGSNPHGGIALFVSDVSPSDGVFVNKITSYQTPNKASVKYDISKLPAHFFVTISNGETFSIDLYKSANWTIRLFKNI